MWCLFPLLLAAALTIPLIDMDAFNGDEPSSLIAAGILRSGPGSLGESWNFISSIDQTQAHGWPLLLFIWGRLFGWSEVAVRALPLLAGVLALAWVYRTGRDLLSPQAGLFATLLLGASVFFHAYMIHARPFALVALFTILCVWSYWRIALHPRPPGRAAHAALLLSSIGLFYMHYFCALLVPILGIFHLFFVPKNRRWRQPVILFGVAALLAMLQLPGVVQGFATTAAYADQHEQALSTPTIVSLLVLYMTNGLIDPSSPFVELLLISLPLAILAAILLLRRAVNRGHAFWMLVFAATALLALIIFINEIFRVILTDTRIRYLMPLWPLTALLAGVGLSRLARIHRLLVAGLMALWLLTGAWLTLGTDLRYELGNFFRRNQSQAIPVIRDLVPAKDFLILDYSVESSFQGWFFYRKRGISREPIYRYKEDPYENVRPLHTDYPFASLIYFSKNRVAFADLPQELGRVFCERVLDEWGFTLERYAIHSVENCPDSPVRLAYDSYIQLTTPEIILQDDLLRLDAHFRSVDEQLLANYSLAVHVFDTRTGERVAQGDTSVGPGAIVPLRSEIDISALPPGDYEVRVALYDWRTGERLQARDLETDAGGDMHTLHHFRIG